MKEELDFFISYTGKDQVWAEWIAWILEVAGYRTLIQAWDFSAASNFVLKMQSGASSAVRTIALLTPEYFESAFTQSEWAAAFASDPKSENGKLIAIRVKNFVPRGLFAAIVYIDLVNLTESQASDKLIDSILGIVSGKRLKPATKPGFPGSASSTHSPIFPGANPKTVTLFHNLPFAPNRYFTGREELLESLRTALITKEAAAITQPQAVHGLGGVGKTQLAIEYAWRHQLAYDVILWTNASSQIEIHTGLASFADLLRLGVTDVKDQENRIRIVIAWLRSHERWLLIFDNADTKEAEETITKVLPPGLSGHILVTSRRTDWPVNFADLEVSVLPVAASIAFLLKRTQKPSFNPGTENEAEAVAKDLGFLPLALEQAAAYMIKHRVTFNEFKERLEQSRRKLLGFSSQGGTGYQRTVATTWLVTEQKISDLAKGILNLVAFFAPNGIPRKVFTGSESLLLQTVSTNTEISTEAIYTISTERIDEVLAELHENSLIQLESESFSCHRLLQAVVLDRMDKPSKEIWFLTASTMLAAVSRSNPDNPASWPNWLMVSPQIESLLRHHNATQKSEPVLFLMMQLATYYQAVGHLKLAEPLMRGAMALKSEISSDWTEVADFKVRLADLLYEAANYVETELLCNTILKDLESVGQTEGFVYFKAVSLLAAIMQDTDRFIQAESLFKRALAVVENAANPLPRTLPSALNNLSFFLTVTHRYAEAEPLLRRSVAILEKLQLTDESDYTNVLFNLARCLHQQGMLHRNTDLCSEAEKIYRKVLDIDKEMYGDEHIVYARDANNLGWLLHDIGKLDEAEILLRQAIKIEESTRSIDHPHIATSLGNLGRVLTAKGSYGEAEKVLRQSLGKRENTFGKQNHAYAIGLANLAFALIGLGQSAKAEECLKETVQIDEKCFGAKHVEVAQDLLSLGTFYYKYKRYSEAAVPVRRALNIFNKEFGANHFLTIESHQMLDRITVLRSLIMEKGRKGVGS